MDRRQMKTQRAILTAFRNLLSKKRYDRITVQEIIDEADVGRSTFYAHFETKELLLDALCSELFDHIFEKDPCPWAGRDSDIEGKLSHILWHIRDSNSGVSGILLSDSGDIFMTYFRAHLKNVFKDFSETLSTTVPRDFLLNHLVSAFAEAVRWWLREGMKTSPEEMAKYYLATVAR